MNKVRKLLIVPVMVLAAILINSNETGAAEGTAGGYIVYDNAGQSETYTFDSTKNVNKKTWSYNKDTNTITLKNFKGSAIHAYDDINIKVIGTNYFGAGEDSSTIEAEGNLKISGTSGSKIIINNDNSVSLIDGIYTDGKCLITGCSLDIYTNCNGILANTIEIRQIPHFKIRIKENPRCTAVGGGGSYDETTIKEKKMFKCDTNLKLYDNGRKVVYKEFDYGDYTRVYMLGPEGVKTVADGNHNVVGQSFFIEGKSIATDIKLNRSAASLKSGDRLKLSETVSPVYTFDKSVTWTSSDKSVATVSKNGTVTALKGGSCTITATTVDGSKKSARCRIAVNPTIKYVTRGGKNNTANPSYYKTSCGITLKNPTRKGYVFGGWYTNSKCTSSARVTAIKKGNTRNYTLYAKWNKVSVGRVNLHSLSSAGNTVKTNAVRVRGAAGYEIVYAENTRFTAGKKTIISKTPIRTITGLSRGRYYVRIRAYKMVGKTKIYGAWSARKSVKIKR